MTMKPLVLMQSAWAAMLLLVALIWSINGHGARGFLVALLVLAYAYAIFALSRRRAWAWWCCLALPTASLVLAGPGVVYNVWLAGRGDPHFSDSPGTLLVVLITALFLVISPIILLMGLLRIRGR